MIDYWPALYSIRSTLSSTLVGFAMAVGFGLLLACRRLVARVYAGVYPLMIASMHPQVPCADPGAGFASDSFRRC